MNFISFFIFYFYPIPCRYYLEKLLAYYNAIIICRRREGRIRERIFWHLLMLHFLQAMNQSSKRYVAVKKISWLRKSIKFRNFTFLWIFLHWREDFMYKSWKDCRLWFPIIFSFETKANFTSHVGHISVGGEEN